MSPEESASPPQEIASPAPESDTSSPKSEVALEGDQLGQYGLLTAEYTAQQSSDLGAKAEQNIDDSAEGMGISAGQLASAKAENG